MVRLEFQENTKMLTVLFLHWTIKFTSGSYYWLRNTIFNTRYNYTNLFLNVTINRMHSLEML